MALNTGSPYTNGGLIIIPVIEQCQDLEEDVLMVMTKIRQTYRHGNLEEALISAAKIMVRKDGAEHLSLRAVAVAVGVSPSAAYHYYPDKDALISRVGMALFEQLADVQEVTLSNIRGKGEKAARARFRALGQTYFDWAVKEPNFFRLMFGGYCSIDLADTTSQRESSRAWNLLRSCLDDLYNVGLISSNMRPYGEIFAWSAVHGATSLIVEGHLPAQAYESILDAIELSLGMGKP
jgi:AcrR family transcriptional regulator